MSASAPFSPASGRRQLEHLGPNILFPVLPLHGRNKRSEYAAWRHDVTHQARLERDQRAGIPSKSPSKSDIRCRRPKKSSLLEAVQPALSSRLHAHGQCKGPLPDLLVQTTWNGSRLHWDRLTCLTDYHGPSPLSHSCDLRDTRRAPCDLRDTRRARERCQFPHLRHVSRASSHETACRARRGSRPGLNGLLSSSPAEKALPWSGHVMCVRLGLQAWRSGCGRVRGEGKKGGRVWRGSNDGV